MTSLSSQIGHGLWRDQLVDWKDQSTWLPTLQTWVEPIFRNGGLDHLRAQRSRSLPWDDDAWLRFLGRCLQAPMQDVVTSLANDLYAANLIAYHGTSVPDAGVFHREGIKISDPAEREADIRRVLAEEPDLAGLMPFVERSLRESKDFDAGKLWLVADDRELTELSSHYLLYGSERVKGVLGDTSRHVLRRRGIPTMIVATVPMKYLLFALRENLARSLLRVWTRNQVNGSLPAPLLLFGFSLKFNLPAENILTHYHPTRLRNLKAFGGWEEIEFVGCPHCLMEPNAV